MKWAWMLVTLLLIGCASQQQMSAMNDRAKEASEKGTVCATELYEKRDFLDPMRVLSDRFYFPQLIEDRSRLSLSDTANPEEKIAWISLRNTYHQCLQSVVIDMGRVHPLLAEVVVEAARNSDIWITALLDDRITVGEYNRIKLGQNERQQQQIESALKELSDNSGRFDQFWNESLLRADKALDSWTAQQRELKRRAQGYRTPVSVLDCDFVGSDLRCEKL